MPEEDLILVFNPHSPLNSLDTILFSAHTFKDWNTMTVLSEITLSSISESDRKSVVDLFNYYIENSYAAYPEQKVPYEFFSLFLDASRNYPSVVARGSEGTVAGFGLLRPHNPMAAFRHTAEVTYFLRPEMTRKGLGTRMFEYLETAGRKQEITSLLASISSLNDGSIRFHTRQGFTECGRFLSVGMKKGVVFDMVWMQKFI
ncbi:MAG: N-acetyltransferase family protein [Methanoregula sp.]|uniref:GNAT family N-acetyltransferase n=1 Tax=Methanoregula sp. TaxID=2052170 RepID=UPI0025EDC57A|nr:GNAT family N-acetyltransferase [Methanoregula sp.]MCK9631256.1 N-acetyltransferase family protein [Methanoregula sp.]